MLERRSNIDNFTDQELRWSYWYVTHKSFLKTLIFVLICLFNLILFLIISYKVYEIFSVDDNSSMAFLSDSHKQLSALNIGNSEPVQELAILDTLILNSSKGFDLVARIGNSNPYHIGYFSYRFNSPGHSTSWRTAFVYPMKDVYIHELGYDDFPDMNNSTVELGSVNWQKITRFEDNYTERFDFPVEDAQMIGLSDQVGTGSTVLFSVRNKTSFDYKKIGFTVLLYSGSSLFHFNYVVLDGFDSGGLYNVEVPFYGVSSAGLRIEVIPVIDIFDPSLYKKPSK